MLVAAVLLAGRPAMAQPPVFAWWDSPIARDMNLSQDQMRKIRMVVRDHRARLIQLRANVETADSELGELMREESFDMARASDAAEKAVQARGEMTRALTQLSVRLRAVLTLEQWTQLENRRPRRGLK